MNKIGTLEPVTADNLILRANLGTDPAAPPGTHRARPAEEAWIDAAEERLNVRLPPALKEIYRRCNGGYVGWVVVPMKPDATEAFGDWHHWFSFDYCLLLPVQWLDTVENTMRDHLEPDEVDLIPAGADRMIALSRMRYWNVTYLDYRQPGVPRVVSQDFEVPGESAYVY